MTADDDVAAVTARYPAGEIRPAEFEQFVVDLLSALGPAAGAAPVVTLHDKIEGADGTYDFDATARFNWGGMSFLVLAEAKLHKHPIKRELVQVLNDKLRSVGAQKAVMFSTAPYQSGALSYAKAHGIALATVTEGRHTYETRSRQPAPPLTRQQAAEWGIPPFVAHAYTTGVDPGTTLVLRLSSEDPDYVAEVLLPRPGPTRSEKS
ncbi:restriction endonuclease [uncultured Friedmanniella sp.]|uniref:restriction endonuclease n=1 Tax=uncultured Friedmanniella sp. TaxID=335381 RepID=UPI0035CA6B0D